MDELKTIDLPYGFKLNAFGKIPDNYVVKSMKYLIPALKDFSDMLSGSILSPIDFYEKTRKSLHFVGYEGLSLTAVSGLDMAVWDALAKAASMPLCVFLGGSIEPVKAYSSNGLWLKDPNELENEAIELLNEGAFSGIKLRLGREKISQDLQDDTRFTRRFR